MVFLFYLITPLRACLRLRLFIEAVLSGNGVQRKPWGSMLVSDRPFQAVPVF